MSNSDKTQLLAANKTIDDLIQRLEYEKKRGDILQSELDSIDDFNACVDEHEVDIRVIN
jgi:hypothetical protein